MIHDNRFDDIRPYYDEEIPAAMERIANSEFLPLLASYVYPGHDIEQIRQMMRSFRTTREFQLEVMRCVNEQVIARSITEFTYSGLERLDTNQRYLFVSNHRDIMLDACLLQYALHQYGHETCEITFGANLMSGELVIDIGKANKMFRVERGGNMKDFYRSSLHLSDYIRHCITEKHQSVWIAQRNGRTKDGNDQTDQGIIKMFGMSRTDSPVESLAELHIVPISISYEWESCDVLKALELYQSRSMRYIKKPGEDLNSILTGIVQPKGRVHIHFGRMLTAEDMRPFETCPSSEFHRHIAALIDSEINSHYRLIPNNYIAHDLLYDETTCQSHYTPEERDTFIAHMSQLSKYEQCDPFILREIFLGIYANPINNR